MDPLDPFHPPSWPFLSGNHSSILCVCLLVFLWFGLLIYFLFLFIFFTHIWVTSYYISLSLSHLFHLVSSMLLEMARFYLLFGWVVCHYVYIYTTWSFFIHWWQLSCFHNLAFVNDATVNIGVCISVYNFIFVYSLLAVLGLGCCVWALSSCREWGLLFVVVCRLLLGVAFPEHGL